MTGQGVVVTGAARGIGEALATRLAAAGARVVVNDLDHEALAFVAQRIGACAAPGDAASTSGVRELYLAARAHLGEIDAWFANAGMVRGFGLDAPDDEWLASWDVNTMAHVRAARLLLPDWLDRGRGRFVVTASAAGLLSSHRLPAYAATKHAAVAFAEWLSLTYRHRGIVVQAICPEGVVTDLVPDAPELRNILFADGALHPGDVAEATWQGLLDDRFLILPHPQVAQHYEHRATNTGRWLNAMNKLQQHIEQVTA